MAGVGYCRRPDRQHPHHGRFGGFCRRPRAVHGLPPANVPTTAPRPPDHPLHRSRASASCTRPSVSGVSTTDACGDFDSEASRAHGPSAAGPIFPTATTTTLMRMATGLIPTLTATDIPSLTGDMVPLTPTGMAPTPTGTEYPTKSMICGRSTMVLVRAPMSPPRRLPGLYLSRRAQREDHPPHSEAVTRSALASLPYEEASRLVAM